MKREVYSVKGSYIRKLYIAVNWLMKREVYCTLICIHNEDQLYS